MDINPYSNEKICPFCFFVNSPKAKFCGNCSQALPRSAKNSRFLWVGVGLLVLLIILAGGYWFSKNPPPTTVSPTPVGIVVSPTSTPALEPLPTLIPTLPHPTLPTLPHPLPTLAPSVTPQPSLTPEPTASPTLNLGPETLVIGYSVRNQPLEVVRFGAGSQVIIFVGGLNTGFAPSGALLAERVIALLRDNPAVVPETSMVYVILNGNPDSPYDPGNRAGRLNAHGVDLNRNWGCKWQQNARFENERVSGGDTPFSEPETKALADFITGQEPVAVIFWTARFRGGLASPGYCEGASPESEALSEVYGQGSGYPAEDYEKIDNGGVALTGDATNWLASQGIPAIAVLLDSHTVLDWEENLGGVLAVLDIYGK